jgi:hypothetical protein
MNPCVTFGSGFVDDFQAASTQFSFTISESTRVVGAEEAMRHLWKWYY